MRVRLKSCRELRVNEDFIICSNTSEYRLSGYKVVRVVEDSITFLYNIGTSFTTGQVTESIATIDKEFYVEVERPYILKYRNK